MHWKTGTSRICPKFERRRRESQPEFEVHDWRFEKEVEESEFKEAKIPETITEGHEKILPDTTKNDTSFLPLKARNLSRHVRTIRRTRADQVQMSYQDAGACVDWQGAVLASPLHNAGLQNKGRAVNTEKENRQEDGEMQAKSVDTKEAPGTLSSSRGEKRTEMQENVPVKKRLMTKSSRKQSCRAVTCSWQWK